MQALAGDCQTLAQLSTGRDPQAYWWEGDGLWGEFIPQNRGHMESPPWPGRVWAGLKTEVLPHFVLQKLGEVGAQVWGLAAGQQREDFQVVLGLRVRTFQLLMSLQHLLPLA